MDFVCLFRFSILYTLGVTVLTCNSLFSILGTLYFLFTTLERLVGSYHGTPSRVYPFPSPGSTSGSLRDSTPVPSYQVNPFRCILGVTSYGLSLTRVSLAKSPQFFQGHLISQPMSTYVGTHLRRTPTPFLMGYLLSFPMVFECVPTPITKKDGRSILFVLRNS